MKINAKMNKINRLSVLIDNLSDKDKIILSLFFIEELSFNEIANILELEEKEIKEIFDKILENIKIGLRQKE